MSPRFVELAPEVWVNADMVAMVRPHTQSGWVAVVFATGGCELVAGSVGSVLALLSGDGAVTS